ncbi:MAG: hypothetical protein U0Q11_23030 [Vicinamibacterales bacterium]
MRTSPPVEVHGARQLFTPCLVGGECSDGVPDGVHSEFRHFFCGAAGYLDSAATWPVSTGVPQAMASTTGSPKLAHRRKHEELREVVDGRQIFMARSR